MKYYIALLILLFGCIPVTIHAAGDYPIQPVPFTEVHFEDAFWAPRMETNRTVTIPFAFKQCEDNGRMSNFAIAGGLAEGEQRGDFPFDDTDPYKILEGASYCLMLEPDPKLDKYLDDLIALFATAQEEDGYLYTVRTNQCDRLRNWFGDHRWSRLSGSHELYNAGHMYEAAVAHYQATGKRSFLEIAIKNADLIDRTFGPDQLHLPPGHQVIEMGLCKLYRATGEERYLKLAKFLLDMRGRSEGRRLYGSYSQDHKPVVEQSEAVGHAVRATYMYAGMADVAALTGDEDYIRAIGRIWDNVVSRKLYVTGGVGARGSGEAFGDDYELPNMSAYCETCAAIGNVYWNHRMFLLHGDARYIDVMERTLYNGLISGVSLDGKLFFYPNPLESQGQHNRSPWFGCACCPGNITRFMASVPGYAYAHRGDSLYVNLYATGKSTIPLEGRSVQIRQTTEYPWDGKVRMEVIPEKPTDSFTLCVRIPGWARNEPVPSDLYRYLRSDEEKPKLKVNGDSVDLIIKNGYVSMDRTWKRGDVVDLALSMPIHRIVAHPNIKEDTGKVALQRGPLIYCAEWPDNNGRVLNLLVEDDAVLQARSQPDLLGGVTILEGTAKELSRQSDGDGLTEKSVRFRAIPYYAWAHRGSGEMAVWLARKPEAAKPLPAPTIASRSKVSTSFKSPTANARIEGVNDQVELRNSIDHEVAFLHWWPHKGTTEWLQYEFAEPAQVAEVLVYWFDDTGRGECRVPKSWRLFYEIEGQWEPVQTNNEYYCDKDRFNVLTFNTVKTNKLRMEVTCRDGFSAGVMEWTVK
ncbi:MAG: glycoside hydrolase family 127 protein [Sedimentisphaerales bacterium]|nr:glycoside hydrolase family 127 protein [Sedimentisphaerales bacterium]